MQTLAERLAAHWLTWVQLLVFFALSYLFSWLFFVPLALSRAGIGWLPLDLSLPVMTVLGTFGPSAAAFFRVRYTGVRVPGSLLAAMVGGGFGAWVAQRLFGMLLALAVSPLLVATTYAVIPALVLTAGPASQLGWGVLVSPSVFTLSTIIGGPLGEEPGWRGTALPRLQEVMGPAAASLVLGVLWASWHLPLFFCKNWESAGFPTYLLIVTGLSFSMTFLYNLSRGSVLVAIVAHGMFNTCSRWLGGLLGDSALREGVSPELVMGLSGWAVGVVLLVATRGRLGAGR